MWTHKVGDFPKRHAISRARFFLDLAKQCPVDKRDEFEAYLEASIIFGRTALHRLKSEYERRSNWKPWWDELRSDPAVEFFRKERNWILKNGPPKIGQIIGVGKPLRSMAAELYYYEDPKTPATETVEKHLKAVEDLLVEAQSLFSES
jgi:hypothetical protein